MAPLFQPSCEMRCSVMSYTSAKSISKCSINHTHLKGLQYSMNHAEDEKKKSGCLQAAVKGKQPATSRWLLLLAYLHLLQSSSHPGTCAGSLQPASSSCVQCDFHPQGRPNQRPSHACLIRAGTELTYSACAMCACPIFWPGLALGPGTGPSIVVEAAPALCAGTAPLSPA